MKENDDFSWEQDRFPSSAEYQEQDAETFAQLLSSTPLAKQMNAGQMLTGKIVEVGRDFALVDVGLKSEALVPISEFEEGTAEVGMETEVCLTKRESFSGQIVLSREQALRERRWEHLLSNCREGEIVEGKITQRAKGGLAVDIGVEAFLPNSQIEERRVKSLREYIGKTYQFKIVKVDVEKRNITLSRRQLLEEERISKRSEVFESLKVGETAKGKVRNITDFGAFIDVQGVDGLLHIKDISWKRISHPSEMLHIGQELDVLVLEIDTAQSRLALGLKQLIPNPWHELEKAYPPGTRLNCKVTNIVSYGIFVEIEQGIEGLVHVSEMSWLRNAPNPNEICKKGDIVDVIVLNVQKEEERISLGMKQVQENPWEGMSSVYPVGSRVQVEIIDLRNYGALARLENELEGLIHISDISWNKKIGHPSELLNIGQKCTAVILVLDEQEQKISLGLKQLSSNPWDKLDQLFPIGSLVAGEVSQISPFGVFVTLEHEIEGLVHITEIANEKFEKIEDMLEVGQQVTAKVLKVDKENKKISLSLKQVANE